MHYPHHTPQWAPSKPLIVSDPSKLSYFARANATRAGLDAGAAAGAAGSSFAGLNVANFAGVTAASNRIDPVSAATGGTNPTGNASDVAQGGQSVSDFLDRLSRATGSFFSNNAPPASQTIIEQPSPGPLGIPIGGWILGSVAVLGIGFLLMRK